MDQRRDTQEHNLPWRGGFRLFRKEDGWLGILYRIDGEHRIATRGSFKSSGAVFATSLLKKYNLDSLPDDVTLVFEIICPITRVVVDYGDRSDLVLLAAYNRHTGEEYSWDQVSAWGREFGFTFAESYDKHWLGYCRGQLKTVSGAKLEGFVIRFDNGLRVKIKSEDYFRRSHLLMSLTPIGVWNEMEYGKVSPSLWDIIDADYHDTLDGLAFALEQKYSEVKSEIERQFNQIECQPNRAAFAREAAKMSHQAAIFSMFDSNDNNVDQYIMKHIRPGNNVI